MYVLVVIVILTALVHPSEAEVNLVYQQETRQSGEYSEAFPASNAVNGNTSDFSYTAAGQQANWWMVNLGSKYSIGSITLYNRLEPYGEYQNNGGVRIQPSDPSLSSDDWTRVSYQEDAYPQVQTHNFTPPIEGQHVAIFNIHPEGLALAEVEIREYCYSRGKLSFQYPPSEDANNAADGDLSKYSSTRNHTNGWWKVDLGRQILFREVKIFVRDGQCYEEACSSHLRQVYFLTNPTNTDFSPNNENIDDWNICSYSETSLGDEYIRSCDTGIAYPLTRQFSIFSTAETQIELRQVEVYGHGEFVIRHSHAVFPC
ncbi:uncharacterized protein [Watersipora subatra]|uniref:uncharacterized protein n=1 Tax=Watersipora subatra TaxID=2589382 RepID=UPI00355B01D2